METKLIVKLPFEGLRIRPKSNPNDNKANSNKTLSSKERVRKYRQCLQNDTNLKEKLEETRKRKRLKTSCIDQKLNICARKMLISIKRSYKIKE